jgi:hypothetical protein
LVLMISGGNTGFRYSVDGSAWTTATLPAAPLIHGGASTGYGQCQIAARS